MPTWQNMLVSLRASEFRKFEQEFSNGRLFALAALHLRQL